MTLTKTEEETIFQEIRFLNDTINNINGTIRSIKRLEGLKLNFNLCQVIVQSIAEIDKIKITLINERNNRKEILYGEIINGVVPARYKNYI